MNRNSTVSFAVPAATFALIVAVLVTELPPGRWPHLPFLPSRMDLDQIGFAFGTAPRIAIALVAGAVLGLSGAMLQAVLRNPIADPSTLGISSGAQLALVVATIFVPDLLVHGRWPIAMLGAACAAAIVFAIGARRAFAPVTLVIAGMLVSLLSGAIATAITLSQGEYLLSLVIWNGGSLVQQDWSGVRSLGAVLVAGLAAALVLERPLRVLSIGVGGASGLGLNVAAIRFAVLAVAVVLAGAVSAELGLIGFVGLAAPTIARAIGFNSLRRNLLAAPLIGALVLSVCDSLVILLDARLGEMFSTGAVTGLLGGPLLIALLAKLQGSTPPGTESAEPAAARIRHPYRALLLIAALLLVGVVLLLLIGRLPSGWTVLDWEHFMSFLPMRLPRLIAAGAAGAALAIAGALLQRLTANPLASPEVLGVAGGASLGYGLAVFATAAPSALMLNGATVSGGIVALVLVAVFVSRRDMPPERILLAGIAVSAFASSVLAALMATGDPRAWRILGWLSGSSAAIRMTGAVTLAAVAASMWVAAAFAARRLAIMPLGAGVAGGLGVNIPRTRFLLILIAGTATGVATIFVGPLSFVGLMAPHMASRAGFHRASQHLHATALIGACLMVCADFGARMAGFPYELPLGLFASLIGAPWLMATLLRKTG
ncbi:Fe(3+)-hydroxamate ABC transporter permease FhuB [Paracoccus sp. 1_MG-2023]|uniref:Fe(3+)-hydroxamate ABC transporter permease FhuB n=1 Tax=unclassified Paracoccus (in: a-proteobacteria) TaxID=2688777 RepID=UPI001C094181|nr:MULTISPECIES: Fe(3+)-hydroxamate ABC transporter permease FhuB [unclassified Paracoccus (in: a-proteobacteria)]MBU2957604.1 Fe(3+)-hydroxamate ABC transporter permease FhuB [Paracoccus sp. C2R09]MDO6670358.1 Fe(3+)-hydroxamate ABC transporter permease FhuB [Paracoccus sp. 1_MG-2023]